jgi:hypothetical protein
MSEGSFLEDSAYRFAAVPRFPSAFDYAADYGLGLE